MGFCVELDYYYVYIPLRSSFPKIKHCVFFSDKLVKLFRVCDDSTCIEELLCSPIDNHTYTINYVEFSKDGTMLATCSLDGSANIWNPIVSIKRNHQI